MAAVRELHKGVWHWQAPHPEWKPGAEWDETVSSYAVDDGQRLLLFDPLAVPGEIEELAGRRETAIVLTCPWHERDAQSLLERLAVPVFLPTPDEGSSDAAWAQDTDAHLFASGDRLPVGVEAFPGFLPNDLVLWAQDASAVIAGDTLIDRGQGLEIPEDWLPDGVTRVEVAAGLSPLLSLPVELVLPTHGPPADQAALERALS